MKNFAKHHGHAVLPNQYWARCSDSVFLPARVIAVAEGYAMLRFPRCMPFAVAITDLDSDWRLCPDSKTDVRGAQRQGASHES